MIGHQLFAKKTKTPGQDFSLFLGCRNGIQLASDIVRYIVSLCSGRVYVDINHNVLQLFNNQRNTKNLRDWVSPVRINFRNLKRGINNSDLNVRIQSVSEDYCLFLPLPLLLNVRGLNYSLFRCKRKKGIFLFVPVMS